MNTSFDDQASQSTTTDQQSETSSAYTQSPRSVFLPNGAPNLNSNPFNTSAVNSAHLAQNCPVGQDPYMYHHQHLTSGYSQHHQQDVRNLQQQQQQHQQHRAAAPTAAGIANSAQIRRCYSGVDKLIMAAMVEETAANALASAVASGNPGYMPSGRGIGYLGRDSAYAMQQIPTPSNKSEFELYRLLDKANLLNYFGTFLNFGGDDVQQLSDADEDEFLEIMSLVGMTQKPLHVRRLQKALIEWRESRETEMSSFRRPVSQTVMQPSTTNTNTTSNNNNSAINCDNHGPIVELSSLHQNQPQPQQLVHSMPNSNARASETNNPAVQQPYTLVAHEVLVGAPKRLRLMDNLHKRSTTGDKFARSIHQPDNNYHGTTGSNNKRTHPSPNAKDDNSLDQFPLSPSSQKSTDRDDDKLIEIMDSPRSDHDSEDESNIERSSGESPTKSYSAEFLHNKYGRYKASLLNSPNK